MIFSSTLFLFLFLPIVFLLYFNPIIKNRTFKNIVLLVSSLLFYAWGEPVFLFIMILFVTLNWILGLCIEKYYGKVKIWITITLLLDVGLLIIFKYLTFITTNLAYISGNQNLIVKITLPIGISFFTFQMMSYVFDIAMGKAKAQRNLLNVMLYVVMFPQLIAGPIVRYETVEKELLTRQENADDFFEGMRRFVQGLIKKVLLANNVAVLADTIFAYDPGELAVLTSWLGALAYTLQIYFDFSGYSDMAIGLGRVFGFHFLENFNLPYRSSSVSEFWRRWHISMGTWFRDYIYIPLGGSRSEQKWRRIFNLFAVWIITGLWHGANWTFVLWGLMYFLLISLEKVLKPDRKRWVFGHIYTMFFVIAGWVIFRSDTVGAAMRYLSVMIGFSGNAAVDYNFFNLLGQFWLLLIICIIVSVYRSDRKQQRWAEMLGEIGIAVLFLAAVTFIVKGGYNPFIYFNF